MAGNTRFVYDTEDKTLVKVIADPDSVRVKLCPVDDAGNFVEHEETIDGVQYKPIEASLTRRNVNRLIEDLRDLRARVWGRDS